MFKKPYFWLILIVLLGFLVRLYKIDNPVADWHSWRQADTASVTRLYVKNGINLLYPKYQDISFLQTGKENPEGFRFVEFPLYNGIHAVLVEAMPFFSLEVWGRLLSVFFSLVSTILIYLLGKRFLGVAGGLLSAFFFAFLPFNIFFSRVILPEPLAVMLGLSSLVSFISWLDAKKVWKLVLGASCLSLALLVKPFAVFLSIPIIWLSIDKFGFSKLFKNWPFWAVSLYTILPFMLWRFWILRYPEGIPFYSWMYQGIIRFKPAFYRWIFGERIGRLILGEWGIFIFVIGLLAKSKEKLAYFPHIMFLGAFLYMFIFAEANVRHDYYQTFIIPAVSLVLARGVLHLWNINFLHKILTRLVVVGSIMFMFGFSWYQVKEFYKINHPEIIEAGQAVDRLAPPDALVIAPYNGDTALLYQTNRHGWPYLTYSIEELIKRGATYYVSVNVHDSETQDAYRKFIVLEETDKYIVLKLEPKPKLK